MAKIREDLKEVVKLPFVSSAEVDEQTFFLTVTNGDTEISATIILPEEYPRGEPTLLDDDCPTPLNAGNLSAIADAIYQINFGDGTALSHQPSTMSADDSFDPDTLGVNGLNSMLQQDVAWMEARFGVDSVTVHDLTAIDAVHVSLNLNVRDIIDQVTAKAWGLQLDVPLVVTLAPFSRQHYTDTGEPCRVECRQDKKLTPIAAQLQMMAAEMVRQAWSHPALKTPRASAPPPMSPIAKPEPSRPGSAAPARPETKQEILQAEEGKIFKALVAMGFCKKKAQIVAPTAGSVEEAVQLLAEDDSADAPQGGKPASRQSKKRNVAPKGGKAQQSSFYRDDSNPLDSLLEAEKNDDIIKDIGEPTEGFLVQVASFILRRLPSISNYCVICDQTHLFATAAMIKPAVCTRELCVFAFQELKVQSNAADEIATEAGVVDLLVCMAKAAVQSQRSENIFTPYPQVADPTVIGRRVLALDPNKKDFNRCRQIVSTFPSMQELCSASNVAQMKARMDTVEPLAYPLLQWILQSNRAHIVKLRPADHLKALVTPHQYLLVTAHPTKQEKFNQLKATHGSKFAFHGSPIENWHCILRDGLRNASGSKLQLHGAAHGSGIYFATDPNTSLGYCRGNQRVADPNRQKQWTDEKFIDDTDMVCLALCEIVNKDINDHGWCWTVANEDHVLTRFFFVYNRSAQLNPAPNTSEKGFITSVREAMARHSVQ